MFELGLKVGPSTEVGGSSSEDGLAEGGCPGKGRSFGHVRQCKHDLLGTGLVDFVIDGEIEGDSIQPGSGFCTISINVFRGTESEFDRAGGGHSRWEGCRRGWGW